MTEVKPIMLMYYLKDIAPTTSVYDINKVFQDKMPDYHVLCCPSKMSLDGSCEDIRLEVFHPKDFTDIQFEELKEMVMDEIKKLKQ